MAIAGRIVSELINIYKWLVIARVLLSWFPIPDNEFFRTLYSFLEQITEPYLRLFRKIIPPLVMGGGGIDFSPIIAIVVLYLLQEVVVRVF